MDADVFKDDFVANPSKRKRKIYEVDCDSMSQEAIEELIRKDVDHISSIFGIDVSVK